MLSEKWQHLPYREGVGVMLLNSAGQVFVGRRIDTRSEAWQMPQGGIDEGETPREALLRELAEETGVSEVSFVAESEGWYHYDLPSELVPTFWGGKYRGQKQKWFVVRLEAGDEHINIQTEHPEFEEWKWVEAREVPSLIVPFKREMYTQLVEEFRPFITKA